MAIIFGLLAALLCRYVGSISKCCNVGDRLYDLVNFTCVPKRLASKFEVNIKPGGEEKCVDVLGERNEERLVAVDVKSRKYTDVEDLLLYPKCCPIDKVYDAEGRKCVLGNYTATSSVPLFKIGLPSCMSSWNLAIVDYTDFNIVRVSDGSIVLEGDAEVPHGTYCFDVNAKTGRSVLRVCKRYENVCKRWFESEGVACFAKCCPDGQIYLDGPTCTTTFDRGIELEHSGRFKDVNQTNFGIIPLDSNIMYEATDEHTFYLDKWGSMHVKKYDHWFKYSSKQAFYCIETVIRNGTMQQKFFLIMRSNPLEVSVHFWRMYILSAVMLISSVFLVLSIVCLMMLPERKTPYGCSMLMYFIMRLGFYISYVYSQLFYGKQPCYVTDFSSQFFMLASFSWLNVLCYNLWRSISKVRPTNPIPKFNGRTVFYYSLHGIGFPTFWTLLTFLVWEFQCAPDYLLPNIGEHRCFFDRYPQRYDYYVYFKIPQLILIIVNIFLFIKITVYYTDVKDSVRELNHSAESSRFDRARIAFVIKLSIFAGYTFVLDMFSQVVYLRSDPYLLSFGIIWDVINYLSDTFMFCFLVLNKKVLSTLKEKLHC